MQKKILILRPAYGKVAQTHAEMQSLLLSGAALRVVGTGTYCSLRDMPELAKRYDVCVILSSCASNHYIVFGEM